MLTANFVDYNSFKTAIAALHSHKIVVMQAVSVPPFTAAAVSAGDNVIFRLYLPDIPSTFNADFPGTIAVNSFAV